ncbi:hypothetical protein PIB30_001190 [Stylosanthes scabra]|uniref:DUF7610 domain-containing protein n=1 Tax=Stylosanthes scabra TaxID=79078 RepID=A0ABU6V2E6_9FABA|nr:hypothetical protein [Stylosanthes scabra]
MTKTKKTSVLHSKLEELSSILDDLLLHAPHHQTQSHESLSKDIKNKIAFIRKLLSAEVASNSHSPPPPSISPHHLHHLSERLASMEKAFHAWDTHKTLSSQDIHIIDKDCSACSCTESCFNDEEEEEEEEVFHDDDVIDTDKAMVEFHDEEEKKNKVGGFDRIESFANYEDTEEFLEDSSGAMVERKKLLGSDEETRSRGGSSSCCAKACGFVLGMMFLMGFIIILIFCCCFLDLSVEEHSFVPLPT